MRQNYKIKTDSKLLPTVYVCLKNILLASYVDTNQNHHKINITECTVPTDQSKLIQK